MADTTVGRLTVRLEVDIDAWNAEYGDGETKAEAMDAAKNMIADAVRHAVSHLTADTSGAENGHGPALTIAVQ